jgi:hypothetical protein
VRKIKANYYAVAELQIRPIASIAEKFHWLNGFVEGLEEFAGCELSFNLGTAKRGGAKRLQPSKRAIRAELQFLGIGCRDGRFDFVHKLVGRFLFLL